MYGTMKCEYLTKPNNMVDLPKGKTVRVLLDLDINMLLVAYFWIDPVTLKTTAIQRTVQRSDVKL